MSVKVWIILLLLNITLFIGALVLVIVRHYTRNKYYHELKEDELIKNTKTTNSNNFLYFTDNETLAYIGKYVLCKSMYDRYIICQYLKKYTYIMFYVICFSKRKRVISIKKYEEINTEDTSKIIALHRKTDSVNVIIGQADDVVINKNIIRPLSNKKIMIFSLLMGVLFCTGYYIIGEIIGFLVGSYQLYFYLNSWYNFITCIGALVLGIITFLFASLRLRKKNIKGLSGGVVEYDFH